MSTPPSEPEFPPLAEQAAHLAEDTVAVLRSGLARASRAERIRRLAICGGCEHMEGWRCRFCGCKLTFRSRAAALHCPIEKW